MLPPGQLPRDLRVKANVDYARLSAAMDSLANPTRLRLLAFLTQPHYLEEVASHLKLSRQAARKHLEKLVAIGALQRRPGVRETGAVTEYLLNPQALFLIHDEFAKLGSLRPRSQSDVMSRTLVEEEHEATVPAAAGPSFYVVRGLTTGQRFPLTPSAGPEWTIGRDHKCAVVVAHDPYASNRHALVRWEGGAFILADLSSTNGTYHNWKGLPKGERAALRHGDLVGVGKTLLHFWHPVG